MPEYSPHQLEKLKLDRETADLLAKTAQAYRDREGLQAEPKSTPRKSPKLPAALIKKFTKPETSGSKAGVKRGHYKHRAGPTTSLAKSKYYAVKPPTP